MPSKKDSGKAPKKGADAGNQKNTAEPVAAASTVETSLDTPAAKAGKSSKKGKGKKK